MNGQNVQWEQQCPQNLLGIAKPLAATMTSDKINRVRGEKELERRSRENEFGVRLLEIVACNNIPPHVRISSSIYFKNFIKKYWSCEENVISRNDRKLIQEHLIQVMLNADRQAQKQISETIATIANYDFMIENWQTLKPQGEDGNLLVGDWGLLKALVARLNPKIATVSQIGIVLRIIRSITNEHVDKEKTMKMVAQIRYIVKQFISPLWLQLITTWSTVGKLNFDRSLANPPVLNNESLSRAKDAITGLETLVLIFHDLISVDLIEFFQDTMQEWSKLFYSMLSFDDKFGILSTNTEEAGPIDSLRTAVIKSASLFVSRYDQESQPFVQPFTDVCVQLLSSLDEKERYDLLVAETTIFLQVVVRQSWNKNLFDQNKLNQIVSHILIRNVKLRESDIHMYEMGGEEWVLRDMEGSDFCTRRRGALELLRKLCEVWPVEISNIVQVHVSRLLQNYSKNEKNNYVDFDTAVNLFLATSVMSETKADGAIKLLNGNATLEAVQKFLNTNIMPYLSSVDKSPHSLVAADCLKYTIMFRSHYPQSMFEELVTLSCQFLRQEDFVTHTYAAIAMDKILSMKKKGQVTNASKFVNNDDSKQASDMIGIAHTLEYKYPKQKLLDNLGSILVPLFGVLTNFRDSFENEYVMKAIMKVIVRAEDACGKFIEQILEHMIKIIERVSKNPSKPTFNHYMFEIVAACIHYTCKNEPGNVAAFEKALMQTFTKILENDACNEFHPYVFQIISLMLRIRNQVNDSYVQIYDSMLKTDQWLSEGNIIAISSMFGDFYKILHNDPNQFAKFMTKSRLEGTLGIYQHLLCKRTHDVYAFRVLSALFEYCPMQSLHNYMKPILELVFSRLKAQKTVTLCAQFVKSLAVFIIKHKFDNLYNYCETIQNGIFKMILTSVWFPYCRNIMNLTDRLIVTHAMILILCNSTYLQNNDIMSVTLGKLFCTIIDVFERAPLEDKDLSSVERRIQTLEDQGAGAKFSTLIFARPPNHNIAKQMGDPRKALVNTVLNLSKQNPQFKQFLEREVSKIDKKYIVAFGDYAKQFGIRFALN